jgi:hypothetical protein
METLDGSVIRNRISAGADPDVLLAAHYGIRERETLRRLARSPRARDRRLCLDYLGAADRASPAMRKLILEAAGALIPALRGGRRWRLFALLGDLVESHPRELWPIVERWGAARSPEIRSAVGVCLLEHLLENRFDRGLSRVSRILEAGGRRFAFTVRCAYRLGEAARPRNRKALDDLLRRFPSPEHRRYAPNVSPARKRKWRSWNRRVMSVLEELIQVLEGMKKSRKR